MSNILSVDDSLSIDVLELDTVLQELEIDLCEVKGENGYKVLVCFPFKQLLVIGWEINKSDWEQRDFDIDEKTAATSVFNSIEIKPI